MSREDPLHEILQSTVYDAVLERSLKTGGWLAIWMDFRWMDRNVRHTGILLSTQKKMVGGFLLSAILFRVGSFYHITWHHKWVPGV